MDEIGFRSWLIHIGKNKKVQADAISRLKTLQRELGACDLDDEYSADGCSSILAALQSKGENDAMRSFGAVHLPIGKYTLSTYRYALNMYIQFRNSQK
ncbi:MAG: hypothetical protein J6Q54_09270 [Oscillospiraceae bacterium]|nr:hypothetical protein [Oscillospiraceae bacterium]